MEYANMQICRIFSDKAISPRAPPEGNGPEEEEGPPESLVDTVLLQEYANRDMYAAGGYSNQMCMQRVGILIKCVCSRWVF